MEFINRITFRLSFAMLCFITVGSMVLYWFYKYRVEDRDIGVVDYHSLKDVRDIKYPLVSMCFVNPFIEQKLNNTNTSINLTQYRQYLKGDIFQRRFENIIMEINEGKGLENGYDG